MLRLLFILFLTVPLIEIYLLIQVGSAIGALPTVALVIFTAVLGAGLLRWQGFATLQRVRQTMARGELPAIEMFEGAILLVCGALLLTPGFFTDIIGFLGLVPFIRRGFVLWLIGKGMIQGGAGPSAGPLGRSSDGIDKDHKTIEGKFWRDDD
jgi:UPF0716 protein FxsA